MKTLNISKNLRWLPVVCVLSVLAFSSCRTTSEHPAEHPNEHPSEHPSEHPREHPSR